MYPLKSYLPTTKRCSRSAKMCPLSVEFPSDIKYSCISRTVLYVCVCVCICDKTTEDTLPLCHGPHRTYLVSCEF